MAHAESTLVELGTVAPDFTLPDVTTDLPVSLSGSAGSPVLLIIFMCNHCPFVRHILSQLVQIGKVYASKKVSIIAISSNDVEQYPQDSPVHMAELARSEQFPFPYLYDESQEVAKAYRAACTPDFFLYDIDRMLIYHGQMDDARPDNRLPNTGDDLRAALDSTLEGIPFPPDQDPSIGCSIKWKPGNEPDYFKA